MAHVAEFVRNSHDAIDRGTNYQNVDVTLAGHQLSKVNNATEGERFVAISLKITKILDAWLDHQREDREDEYGRSPLRTTEHGRLVGSTIREKCYKSTRLCYYGDGCPMIAIQTIGRQRNTAIISDAHLVPAFILFAEDS